MNTQAMLPVSPGEMLDRLSILTIKQQKLRGTTAGDTAHHLHCDLQILAGRFLDRPGTSAAFELLIEVNTELWEVEDELRKMDDQVFPLEINRGAMDRGELIASFCELARRVYNLNDDRSDLKREIDEMLGAVVEPKQYTKYERSNDRRNSSQKDSQEEGAEAGQEEGGE